MQKRHEEQFELFSVSFSCNAVPCQAQLKRKERKLLNAMTKKMPADGTAGTPSREYGKLSTYEAMVVHGPAPQESLRTDPQPGGSKDTRSLTCSRVQRWCLPQFSRENRPCPRGFVLTFPTETGIWGICKKQAVSRLCRQPNSPFPRKQTGNCTKCHRASYAILNNYI